MNLKNFEYGTMNEKGEVIDTNMKGDSIWPSIYSLVKLSEGLMKKNNDSLKTIELDFSDFVLLLALSKEKIVCVKLKDRSEKSNVHSIIREM